MDRIATFAFHCLLFHPQKENNAVAEISLTDGIVSDLIPLPRKNWTGVPVDISDRDGGNVNHRINTI